jgi:hypothetical protein
MCEEPCVEESCIAGRAAVEAGRVAVPKRKVWIGRLGRTLIDHEQ